MVTAKESDGDGIVPVGMNKSAIFLKSLSPVDILAQVRGGPPDICKHIEATPRSRKITSFFEVQAVAAPPAARPPPYDCPVQHMVRGVIGRCTSSMVFLTFKGLDYVEARDGDHHPLEALADLPTRSRSKWTSACWQMP
jgi:hypothetical protein